jgi:uncharacterized protein (DUF1330 family)
VLEGEWEPESVTVIKVDSREALLAWYGSAEYAPLLRMRLESNEGDVIVVEGN